MTTLDDLTETERLLLMAAAVHGLGPEADIGHANTARVVGQALDWAGLFHGDVREAWEALGEQNHPAIDSIYGALIRMTHEVHRVGPGRPPERPGILLFEGGGNWDDPGAGRGAAFPHFNSCRLTAHGEHLAQQLLERHPQYRATSRWTKCEEPDE